MKHFFWIVILALNLFATNWEGMRDTLVFRADTLDSGVVIYSDSIIENVGKWETFWVVVKVKDTAQAGFSGDSVNFVFGYQLGTYTDDSTTVKSRLTRDTSWEEILYVLDTFAIDSFGVGPHRARHSYLDVVSMDEATSRAIDTSDVPDYAIMQVRFTPFQTYLMRYWVEGLGISVGQASGYAPEIIIEHQGTIYQNTRNR